jgi:hypothetical protein
LKKLILLISLSTLVLPSYGQRWKEYRQEVIGSVGPNFLLGDVGGAVDNPTNTIRDINFKATSFSAGGGYNYFIRQDMSVVGQLTYNKLTAKDEFAANEARKNRNFDIKTHLVEVAVQYRYYFVKDKFGHSFKLRGASSMFFSQISAYAAIGLAGIYFNPTGKYSDNKYYSLQPLGTEGQGLVGESGKYKTIGLAIPISLGARYSLGKRWSIGAEFCIRKTFTDYIDDVSTVYYDNTAIETAYGEKASFFADPNDGTQPSWTVAGERRGGDGLKDFYGTVLFSVNYKILKGNSFKPRF